MKRGCRFNAKDLEGQPRLAALVEKARDRDATLSAALVESVASHEPLATPRLAQFSTRVCIHVHSIRKRLCDPDGISAKYAIDAIARSGLLRDDSSKEVKEVTFSQRKTVKGEAEQTIITLEG